MIVVSHSRPSLSRRLFIGGLILAGAATAFAADNTNRATSVLFVCQYGTVKSAIAREVFKRRARERGATADVSSRGITPIDHVSAALRARLIQEGLDAALAPVTQLDQAALSAADIVVLFDRLPPSLIRPGARDWSAMPSMNDTYDQARAFLDPRIEALLDEIA